MSDTPLPPDPNQSPDPAAHTPPIVRRRSFVNDGLRVILTNFVHIGAMVGVGIATAQIWGAETRGALAAVMIVPSLVGQIFDLGLKKVIPRRLGRSGESPQRIIGLGTSVWMCSVMMAMLIATLYTELFSELDVPIWWHAIAIGMILPIRFTEMSRGVALGVQDIGAFNRMFWIRDPIPLVLILVLGYLAGVEAWAYLVALLAAHCVSAIVGLVLMRRHGMRRPVWDPRAMIGFVKEGITYSLGSNLMRLIYIVDVVIMTVMLSWIIKHGAEGWFESRGSASEFKSEMGNYTVGVALAQMIWQVPIALGHVLFSRSVNTKDDQAFARKSARLIRTGFVLIIPCSIVLFVLAPHLIPWAYGEDFELAGRVTQVLVPGIVAFFAARLIEADLTGKGRPMLVVAAMAPIVVLNIALNIYLIPRHGVLGAAAVSSTTYTIGTIALALMYKRITGIRLRDLFIPRVQDFPVKKITALVRKAGGRTPRD
jgi:O-antigen/teichoic acid export membrane protein